MKSLAKSFSLLLATVYCAITFGASTSKEDAMQNQKLQQELTQIAKTFPGTIGIYMHDLKTNEKFLLNPDQLFPMASTFKVPVLVQLYRDKDKGVLNLDDRITLKESDKLNYGLLHQFSAGANLTLRDVALLMISVSDNTATDILVNKLTSKRINESLNTLEVEPMTIVHNTKKLLQFFEENPNYDPLDKTKFSLTTPHAMGTLMEKIVSCQATSQESCKDMKVILSEQKINTRMPRTLSHLKDINIAHKTGTSDWATNDIGFIEIPNRPEIILCIYTMKKDKNTPRHTAEEVIGNLTHKVVEHYYQS